MNDDYEEAPLEVRKAIYDLIKALTREDFAFSFFANGVGWDAYHVRTGPAAGHLLTIRLDKDTEGKSFVGVGCVLPDDFTAEEATAHFEAHDREQQTCGMRHLH